MALPACAAVFSPLKRMLHRLCETEHQAFSELIPASNLRQTISYAVLTDDSPTGTDTVTEMVPAVKREDSSQAVPIQYAAAGSQKQTQTLYHFSGLINSPRRGPASKTLVLYHPSERKPAVESLPLASGPGRPSITHAAVREGSGQ